MTAWSRIKSKYGATRTADGYPSKLEAAVAQLLALRERAGEIFGIKRQQRVELRCPCGRSTGITWRVDFCYTDRDGNVTFVESKGFPTEDYKLKLKLWRNGFSPYPLEVWTGNYRKPILSETVIPESNERRVNGGAIEK